MSPNSPRRVRSIGEIISDELHKAMEAAANEIGRAVRPIYVSLPDGRATHLGSCVLIQVGEQRLLVTAAHVIDENRTASLYIPATGTTTKLEGRGVITTPPKGLRGKLEGIRRGTIRYGSSQWHPCFTVLTERISFYFR
jgi:hypothetical protein